MLVVRSDSYSPTERPSDAIVSMAARANGVDLCFIHGARLADPNKVLLGSGNQTRFIRIDSPQVLERPEAQALVSSAYRVVAKDSSSVAIVSYHGLLDAEVISHVHFDGSRIWVAVGTGLFREFFKRVRPRNSAARTK